MEPEEAKGVFARKHGLYHPNESFCEYDDNVSSGEEAQETAVNSNKIPRSINFQKADDPNKHKKAQSQQREEKIVGQTPEINKVNLIEDIK